jgi:predicted acyl esterase
VTPGQVTEYQIEIFPSLITIPTGDRLRLTLSTTDTPHLIPIPQNLADMVGGIYSINHSAADPSSLSLDLAG